MPDPTPFVPTPEQRRLVTLLGSIGISQPTMRKLLAVNGPSCSIPTLRKAFRDELRSGREMMIAQLGARMYQIAMSDKPQAFSALCFLLRTFGGEQWRVADARRDEDAPPSDGETNVHFYLPPNYRNEPEPDDDDPPTIEAETAAG
jgi:hypothetical protein